MEAVAKLTFDRQYFEVMYSEWLQYRSRYRKIAIPLALLLITIGLLIATWLSSPAIAIAVIIAGIFDVVETLTYRRRWLAKALDGTSGRYAELTFTDTDIRFKSDFSNGTIRYETFDSAVATPDSVFLIPTNGSTVFVPFATIEPQDVVESFVDTLLLNVKRGRQ